MAMEYSGQLAAYVGTLREAGPECAGFWVPFAVGGGTVELVILRHRGKM